MRHDKNLGKVSQRRGKVGYRNLKIRKGIVYGAMFFWCSWVYLCNQIYFAPESLRQVTPVRMQASAIFVYQIACGFKPSPGGEGD